VIVVWALPFQKKSKSGIKTPRRDIELIEKRLAEAKEISDGRKKKDFPCD
jgi:phage-related protein